MFLECILLSFPSFCWNSYQQDLIPLCVFFLCVSPLLFETCSVTKPGPLCLDWMGSPVSTWLCLCPSPTTGVTGKHLKPSFLCGFQGFKLRFCSLSLSPVQSSQFLLAPAYYYYYYYHYKCQFEFCPEFYQISVFNQHTYLTHLSAQTQTNTFTYMYVYVCIKL